MNTTSNAVKVDPQATALRLGQQIIQARRRLSSDAIVLSVVSGKGGPGKTTIVNALVSYLALCGFKALALEIENNMRLMALTVRGPKRGEQPLDDRMTTVQLIRDPKGGLGNSAWGVDVAPLWGRTPVTTRSDVVGAQEVRLTREAREALIRNRGWDHPQMFAFLPGSETLRSEEYRMAGVASNPDARRQLGLPGDYDPTLQLRHAVQTISRDWDFIVLDTAPNLSMLQNNAVAASSHVIQVVGFDADSIDDFDRTDNFVAQAQATVRARGAAPPKVLGVVLNRFNPGVVDDATGQSIHAALLDAYTKPHHDEEEGRTVDPLIYYPILGLIPNDEPRMGNAMKARMSLHTYAPSSPIGTAFYQMCEQVLRGLGISR